MQDHGAREGLRGVGGGFVEGGVVNAAHDFCWVVANLLGEAQILIGAD